MKHDSKMKMLILNVTPYNGVKPIKKKKAAVGTES